MSKFEERDWIVFENDGQKIFGVTHRPLTSNPHPLVVMCHGFGGSKSGRYRHYVKLAESLSKEGIASLRFDFRGCGDSEGHMKDATIEGKILDALQAIEIASKLKGIDKERIGLLGRSMGGAIAVKAAARYQAIKSLALWAPLFSTEKWAAIWKQVKDHPKKFSQLGELKFFGGIAPNPNFLEQFFSIDLEEDLDLLSAVPLLHIQGENDQVIESDQVKKYQSARQGTAATTEMLSLEHTDHDFSNIQEQEVAISKTVEWFKKTLR